MFDMLDTVFRYGRALIFCLFLPESFKVKESGLCEIWNADTAVLLSGAAFRDNRCHSSGKYFWHCVKIYTCWILTYIVYLPCICMANVIIPTQNKLRNIQKISCKFLFACTQYYFCNAKPIHEIDDTVSSMFMSV